MEPPKMEENVPVNSELLLIRTVNGAKLRDACATDYAFKTHVVKAREMSSVNCYARAKRVV